MQQNKSRDRKTKQKEKRKTENADADMNTRDEVRLLLSEANQLVGNDIQCTFSSSAVKFHSQHVYMFFFDFLNRSVCVVVLDHLYHVSEHLY